MKAARLVLGIIVMAASTLFDARQVRAQSGVELENVGATYRFGEQITFAARVHASILIQQASILIFDEARGITRLQPLEIKQDGTAEYRFDTRQNVLPPFTTVRWSYRFTLADGSTYESEAYFIRYDDDRFTWQSLEAGAVRVHWYSGDANFGEAALNAAQAGLQSIRNLMRLDLSKPTDVFIYANPGDLRATLSLGGEEWVAGHANPMLGVAMVVIEAGPEQSVSMEQRIPHELLHVMLYRQVGAGYENIPAWLREGTATLAEVNPNPDYDRVLLEVSARNELIPMKDLCASFSSEVGEAFLAYAESRSFTNYVHGRYGSSGLLTLAGHYADGVDCERGPERAFGVSLSKLELDWRASVLGQNPVGTALGNMLPHFVLLCLVLIVPFAGFLSLIRRKKVNRHGPETYAR